MATKRNPTTPDLSEFERASNPIEAPLLPPPGTPVSGETKLRWEANASLNQPNYSDDLRTLAEEETDNLPEPEPTDRCSEFLSTWFRFSGHYLKVIRLPDPAQNMMPGNQFNRPCRELMMLGTTTFEPLNFEQSLQLINRNSGGMFRVMILDHSGQPIPGAVLDRVLIADPPEREQPRSRRSRDYGYGDYNDEYDDDRHARDYRQPQATPAPPVKSESEIFIEQLQRDMLQEAIKRVMNPPPPPAPPDPVSQLSGEDRLTYDLLKQGEMLPRIVEKLSQIASGPERAEAVPTFKDKLADAALHLVTTNPAVVTQATELASRLITTVVSAFAPQRPAQQIINEPIPVQPVQHHPPAQRATPAIAPPATTLPRMPGYPADYTPVTDVNATTYADDPGSLPETPQDDDYNLDGPDDDPELIMINEITDLMLSRRPLSLEDPVITDLMSDYPEQFALAVGLIVRSPSPFIVRYLCQKSPHAAELFNNPHDGPYLRQRLEELKALLIASANAEQNAEQETKTNITAK